MRALELRCWNASAPSRVSTISAHAFFTRVKAKSIRSKRAHSMRGSKTRGTLLCQQHELFFAGEIRLLPFAYLVLNQHPGEPFRCGRMVVHDTRAAENRLK